MQAVRPVSRHCKWGRAWQGLKASQPGGACQFAADGLPVIFHICCKTGTRSETMAEVPNNSREYPVCILFRWVAVSIRRDTSDLFVHVVGPNQMKSKNRVELQSYNTAASLAWVSQFESFWLMKMVKMFASVFKSCLTYLHLQYLRGSRTLLYITKQHLPRVINQSKINNHQVIHQLLVFSRCAHSVLLLPRTSHTAGFTLPAAPGWFIFS